MVTSEIISRFNLQVDDSSELSESEELALANEVYSDIQDDRAWEWLKSEYSGTTSTSVDYIALPDDFSYIMPNSYDEAVVFVGDAYEEYKVVPFSSRRNYRDQDGFCYIDIANSRLVFTLQPTESKSVEYDYIKIADPLLPDTEPLVTTDKFGTMIAYGMAAKFNPIELSDKSQSYQRENKLEYLTLLSDFRLKDANNKLNIG